MDIFQHKNPSLLYKCINVHTVEDKLIKIIKLRGTENPEVTYKKYRDICRKINSIVGSYLVNYETLYLPEDDLLLLIYAQYNDSLVNLKIDNNNIIQTLLSNLAQGIKDLHNNYIIHGNIHPGNILYMKKDGYKENVFRLSDYCKYLYSQEESLPIASYQFMSPEMISGKEITTKSDMWSLGCILYYLYNKKNPPFSDSNFQLLYSHILSGKYKKLNDISPYPYLQLIEMLIIINPINRIDIIDFSNHINDIKHNNFNYEISYPYLQNMVHMNSVVNGQASLFKIHEKEEIMGKIKQNCLIDDEHTIKYIYIIINMLWYNLISNKEQLLSELYYSKYYFMLESVTDAYSLSIKCIYICYNI